MSDIKVVGFDIAKRIVQACVIDGAGVVIEEGRLRPDGLLAFAGRHAGATMALEACGGAHHWGRQLERLGHQVRLLPPRLVKAYADPACKDDRRDARAIAEAGSRPQLHGVPVKSEAQQGLQSLDRVAALLARQRTQTVNAIHGHLAEFGLAVPKGAGALKRRLPELMAGQQWPVLPEELRFAITELHAVLVAQDERLAALKARLATAARQSRLGRRLLDIPGIGPLAAVAFEAAIGDPRRFVDGRRFAAWLGLTPRLRASAERSQLSGITKRGNTRLRTLLVNGAQALLRRYAEGRHEHDPLACWARHLLARKRWNLVAVALANKLARIVWRVALSDGSYHPRRT